VGAIPGYFQATIVTCWRLHFCSVLLPVWFL